MRIFKYPLALRLNEIQTVQLPEDATILTAQMQGEELVIWAEVQESNDLVDYSIALIGTGQELPEDFDFDNYRYVGTVQQYNGALVIHVYYQG